MTTSTLTRPQPRPCVVQRLQSAEAVTTPRASDGGCPMNGGAESCPADQATIDRCNAC